MGTLLSGPTEKIAPLCPPESLPPSTKTHCARSAKGLFLSGWLAAIGHRRCVPPLKVVLWNQSITPAPFAIGRYRVAQVRTNGSHLARRAPAPPTPRPPPRARCAGSGGARPSGGDWCAAGLGFFDPRVILAWVLATPVALFAAQALMPVVLVRLLAAEGVQRVAVIAGEGELGRKLAERIRIAPFLGIRLAGFFDDRSPERIGAVEPGEILGHLNQVAAYVKTHHVDLIYVTLPIASQPRILKLLDELHDTTASIYFVPDIFLFDLIQAR